MLFVYIRTLPSLKFSRHYLIKELVMDSRMEITYDHLLEDLNVMLAPLLISPEVTDIFPELILKAAGITTKPTRCVLVQDSNDESQLLLNVDGISADESDELSTFLIANNGVNPYVGLSETESDHDDDYSATYSDDTETTSTILDDSDPEPEVSSQDEEASVADEEASVADDDQPDYQFAISVKQAHDQLLPVFAQQLTLLSAAELNEYCTLTVVAIDLEMMAILEQDLEKLDTLFALILKTSASLQSSSISNFIKGQLSILLDDLTLKAIQLYHANTKGHDCQPAKNFLNAAASGLKAYQEKLSTNEALSSNESANQLSQDVDNYIKTANEIIGLTELSAHNRKLLATLSIFGARSQPINIPAANSQSDNSYSDDEPSFDVQFMNFGRK